MGLETMPRISAKRRLTLPLHQCRLIGIEPGDEVHTFAFDGCITIIPKKPGSAWGCLAHLKADETISDEPSRQEAVAAELVITLSSQMVQMFCFATTICRLKLFKWLWAAW